MDNNYETIVFGGGCFWCLDPVFSDIKGVEEVLVGYSGGTIPNPPYKLVCTGMTRHAEVLQVKYNPDVVKLEDLLRVFFTFHDPTTLNRQGADVGPQYRSVIFYANPEQEAIARRILNEIEQAKIWQDPIVTEISPLKAFYPAEDYHQKYFENNPEAGYCRVVIAPKVAKFRKNYLDILKT